MLYSFDDDYLDYAGNQLVTEAIGYARRIRASSVTVAGFRAGTLLSTGERLTEKNGLAEKRAKNIETILRGSGVSNVTVGWKAEPEAADGQTDPSRRRVTIRVSP